MDHHESKMKKNVTEDKNRDKTNYKMGTGNDEDVLIYSKHRPVSRLTMIHEQTNSIVATDIFFRDDDNRLRLHIIYVPLGMKG